ncbi:MAG: tRNA uridine-5-carboxymethylaminomethyl(34) synthesis GTPase MnmE [Acidobacteria bacterium]|nr:tRNA uridine-5-carboxymethylaminomethyl(34) synthesis GTPase MnmE [Acidobacteriota bacterium]
MDSSSVWSFDLAGGADTIVAVATPPGHGALALLRLSGADTSRIAAELCPGLDIAESWRAQLTVVRCGDGLPQERAVAIVYRGPRSYTGEDMLELTVHGSPALVQGVMHECVELGCRPAQPGEFTRRAVANGKMDVTQAEGIADLIAAETAWQLRVAQAQVRGVLSARVAETRRVLVGLLARIEGELDLAAQGVGAPPGELAAELATAVRGLQWLLATARAGERIRDGVRVVILGPPNSGKSTLFNRLLRCERAIVSVHPGTTRDVLEAEVEIGGVRVVLADTAGLRESSDLVEQEGIRRAEAAAAAADVIVFLRDARTVAGPGPRGWEPDGRPWIGVLSKTDLVNGPVSGDQRWVAVSLTTGAGWEDLESRLQALVIGELGETDGVVAVSRRHAAGLRAALNELGAIRLAETEVAAEAVRAAIDHLGEIIGDVTSEEVLDAVFARFCVGK